MHDFRRLDVWRLARALGAGIYRETAKSARPELRLVTAKLRRSALSIASNIAEGCGKSSRGETLRYFEIAAGSAAETEHHLLIAQDLHILSRPTADAYLARTASIRRMLYSLSKRLPP